MSEIVYHGPWPNSAARYRKLSEAAPMLAGCDRTSALKRLQPCLADHEAPLCGHRDGLATFWSCTADLTARKIEYALGAPCRNPYREVFSFQREGEGR